MVIYASCIMYARRRERNEGSSKGTEHVTPHEKARIPSYSVRNTIGINHISRTYSGGKYGQEYCQVLCCISSANTCHDMDSILGIFF